jgi:hypothetical protein
MKVFSIIVWGGMLSILILGFLGFLGIFLLSGDARSKIETRYQNISRSYSVYDASFQKELPWQAWKIRDRSLIVKK